MLRLHVIMLLLLSLFTFISFAGVASLQILQRYSSYVIFIKCTNTGEAFVCCEELVALALVETNVDALFDSI